MHDSSNIPLVVDLDGTLLRSDSLLESLAVLARTRPLSLLRLPAWVLGGKAHFKSRVAAAAQPNVSLFPYRDEVVQLVRNAREQGRKTILASGANESLVKRVNDHLELFDEVHGSNESVNLTRGRKLERIREQHDVYDYVGDSADDRILCDEAREAFAPAGTWAARHIGKADNGHVLGEPHGVLKPLIKAMRLHQWAKNTLIFLPLFLSQQFTDLSALTSTLIAFIAFSLTASGVYIINDLVDIESDRRHPSKRRRPFANGTASPVTGVLLAGGCFVAGIAGGLLVNTPFLLALLGYLAVTTAYSFELKRRAIIDTLTLAMLYTSRLFAGSLAAGIELSFWLLAFSTFIFLSLALVKRCSELGDMVERGVDKAAGRGYTTDDLELLNMMGVASAFTAMLVLALYINTPDVLALYEEPRFLWILCPVLIYWLGRIWLLTRRGEMHDDPIVFAIRDRRSYLMAAIAVVAVALATGRLFG